MAIPLAPIDEMVKEYLVYRGMYATLKSFDTEIRSDKLASHRVDRILELLSQSVHSFEAIKLRDHLQFLENRIFKYLDARYDETVEKLKASACKWYMANAYSQNRIDKLREFLEVFSAEIQSSNELREWFALPFTKQAAESSTFGLYFTRYWLDTFQVSLHNFISACLYYAPKPKFLELELIQRELRRLTDENAVLKAELSAAVKNAQKEKARANVHFDLPANSAPWAETREDRLQLRDRTSTEWSSSDTMDDFTDAYSPMLPIVNEEQEEDAPRGVLKAVIKKLGGGGSNERKDRTANSVKRDVLSSANSNNSGNNNSNNAPSSNVSTTLPTRTAAKPAPALAPAANISAQNPVVTALSGANRQNASLNRLSIESTQSQANRDRAGSDVGILADLNKKQVSASQPATNSNVSGGDSVPSLGLNQHDDVAQLAPMPRPRLVSNVPSSLASAIAAVADTQMVRSGSLSEPRPRALHNLIHPHESFVSACGSRHYELLGRETYNEHQSAIVAARFQPTGEHVASCDSNGIVKIWRPSPSTLASSTVATVMSKSPLTSLDWLPRADGLLFLANRANKLRLFDVLSKKSVRDVVLDANVLNIPLVVSHPTDELCAVCVVDATPSRSIRVLLVDARTFQTRSEFVLPANSYDRDAMTSVCFEPSNSGRLLVGCADGSVLFFDPLSGPNAVRTEQLSTHSSDVTPSRNAVLSLRACDNNNYYAIIDDEPARLLRWNVMTRAVDEMPLHRDALGSFRRPTLQLFAFDQSDPRFLVTPSRAGAIIYEQSALSTDGSPRLSPCFAVSSSDEMPISRTCAVDCSGAHACFSVLTAAMDGSITVSTLLRKAEKS